ncbi:hypothetical protein P153DRAFT_405808 [Dothidotthia symphoricarpi CBS 119687]|uniref:Uncharacterized protein n=1 Tax=Dothidotthia symphoricarpi CBS 119687 TaxID=1392245 RepID=A0A6A6A6U7_9PLEO|nr:uncharacterized protein P153DRAFT_405808 [Dothidotthia symphoricarpi CBS 119687]KAF2127619.1 hypothetical protein P153DRAFT_405808 [Dothidotthia symphoricarpi CBS 119687]
MMALPTVTMTSFGDARQMSYTVPRSDTHDKLVQFAISQFGGRYPQEQWEVHFHMATEDLTDDMCEGRISEISYDKHDYFYSTFLSGTRLRIVAHFTLRQGTEVQPPPSKITTTQSMGSSEANAIVLDVETPPRVKREKPESTAVTNKSLSRDNTVLSDQRGQDLPVYSRPSEPFDKGVFCADLESLKENGPPDTSKYANAKFEIFSHARQGQLVHAHLIDYTRHGVDALEPCAFCTFDGIKCRIYHPSMRGFKVRLADRPLGHRCSGCRFNGHKCNAA